MAHCIASYAYKAVAGDMFVFRVRYNSEVLTVAMRESRGHLSLMQVAGRANCPASSSAMVAIRTWIASGCGSKSESGRAGN